MAERAHPESKYFKPQWKFRLRKGFIPWLTRKESPYAKAAKWRFKWVADHCIDMDVLDIPCGMGWGTSFLKHPKSVVGVDVSEEAIREARSRYSRVGEFKTGSMEVLNFPDESFDRVVCLEGIEHVDLDIGRRFIAEAHRILRAGGKLLISSPYCADGTHSGNPFHIHEYQPEEILGLLSDKFTIHSKIEREVDKMHVLYIECVK